MDGVPNVQPRLTSCFLRHTAFQCAHIVALGLQESLNSFQSLPPQRHRGMLRLRRRPVQLQTCAFRIASGVIDTRTFANMQDDEGYAIHLRIRVLFAMYIIDVR